MGTVRTMLSVVLVLAFSVPAFAGTLTSEQRDAIDDLLPSRDDAQADEASLEIQRIVPDRVDDLSGDELRWVSTRAHRAWVWGARDSQDDDVLRITEVAESLLDAAIDAGDPVTLAFVARRVARIDLRDRASEVEADLRDVVPENRWYQRLAYLVVRQAMREAREDGEWTDALQGHVDRAVEHANGLALIHAVRLAPVYGLADAGQAAEWLGQWFDLAGTDALSAPDTDDLLDDARRHQATAIDRVLPATASQRLIFFGAQQIVDDYQDVAAARYVRMVVVEQLADQLTGGERADVEPPFFDDEHSVGQAIADAIEGDGTEQRLWRAIWSGDYDEAVRLQWERLRGADSMSYEPRVKGMAAILQAADHKFNDARADAFIDWINGDAAENPIADLIEHEEQ